MIAECLGVTDGRINQMTKAGMPQAARGKYSVPDCVRWYIDMRLKSGTGSSNVNEARKKLYDEQIEKTKLETAKLRGSVIDTDDYHVDLNQMGVLFSSGLDAISGRLAAELAGMSDPAEIAERLLHETNEIRSSVANAIVAYTGTISDS